MRKLLIAAFLLLGIVLLPLRSQAQVLGPCGQSPEQKTTATVTVEKEVVKESSLKVNPVPLPGQRAIDFELTAVVGNEIKKIKLSDYQGKWRVLCFFPAAFTFV